MSLMVTIGFSDARQCFDKIDGAFFTGRPLAELGKELEGYLIDNFFNGADNAVEFDGFDFDKEVFTFKFNEG